MRRRWPSASFHSPEWWPEGEAWPPHPGRGYEAWSGFGRTMARRAIGLGLVAVLMPVLIGGAIGFALGAGDADWVVIAGLAVALAVGALVLLAAAGSLFFRTWRPARNLIEAAGRLADGDYSARVPVARSGSLRTATTSFNSMAEQLESAREQRRRLLADVGHELRTPLTVIRGEIEAMVDGIHPPDGEHLEPLLEDVAVMERLLGDLRTLSLAEAGALELHREPTDVVELVEEAAESLRGEASRNGVVIEVASRDEVGEQLVDPVRMREIVINLLVNAIRAMPRGGPVRVEIGAHTGVLQITVVDTGVGIAPEAQTRIFDRFHKGGGSEGTGLGLTISRDLVVAHGGTLELLASSPAGTTMRVTLPLHAAEANWPQR